ITVRDLYESRTVAALASRARAAEALGEASPARESEPRRRELFGRQRVGSQRRPLVATVVQMLWLLTGLALGSSASYLVVYHVFPSLLRRLGVVRLMLVGPPIVFVALVVYMPIAVLVAAVIKKVLIGTYRPLKAPVWGSFYVRNWMVATAVRLVPWQ